MTGVSQRISPHSRVEDVHTRVVRDKLFFTFFLARDHGCALPCLVEASVQSEHTLVDLEDRFYFVIKLLTVKI